MRVLFSSTWGHGHVFPMVPLARAMVEAGHEVLWATNEPACALVAEAGLATAPAGLDTSGVQAVKRRLGANIASLRPQDRAAFAFPNMFGEWATPAMVDDLLPLATDWRPDLMVHEQAELGAPLVATRLGVPAITHAFGGAVPPDFVASAGDRVAALWAAHGLAVPPYAGCFATAYLDICPSSVQTQPLDHVGVRQPLRPVPYSAGESAEAFEGREPLVYLTLGTIASDPAPLAAAVRALAELPVRVLVTVGPDGDPDALGAGSDRLLVRRWVHQADLLRRCAVVVSHAGSGTFLGALGHGVPQLCLPQAADQFRNAAAAVTSGAGLALSPDEASPAAISQAVRRLLVDEGVRAAAGAVAAQIAAMPSPETVVGVLEQLA